MSPEPPSRCQGLQQRLAITKAKKKRLRSEADKIVNQRVLRGLPIITQTPGRIQKVEPPILDSNTPMVLQDPKVDLLFGSARGRGRGPIFGVSIARITFGLGS